MEVSLDKMIEHIFTNPPSESNTITIQLDNPDNKSEKTLFNTLLEIFTKGMAILFGDSDKKVNLSLITELDFLKVKQYFNSFGYNIFYTINDKEIITKSTGLRSYYINLNSNNLIYKICFDYNI